MKHFFALAFVLSAFGASAQNKIWSHAIGNWRNGPTVCITPLIETTEATTKQQLKEQYRADFPELKNIVDADLDVLLFGTKEEGEESRTSLQRKYEYRKLVVVMLEANTPAPER